jgi:fermentation-respiration switch protein FrsA (DUF1100 family)
MYWIKTILLLIVVLYFLGALFLYLFQERLVFMPDTLAPDYIYQFEADFDEISLEMDDGAVLNALHFKTKNPKGLIVYFHGNADDLSRWGEVAIPFVNKGYEVLIADYRGYGKSTGQRSKKKMLKDAETIYAYGTEHWPQDKITVYGRSLGSSFATYIGREYNPAQLILESPFYSVADVAKAVAWMYPVSTLLKFNFKNTNSKKPIGAPVTIIHGTSDLIVPFSSGKKLHEALNGSTFYSIENGGHNDLSNFKEYWEVIDKKLP